MASEELQISMSAESEFNASMNLQSLKTSNSAIEVSNAGTSSGTRNNGRISNTRRFFCLFVTFNFLFTILMWLLCAVTTGPIFQTTIVQQILNYTMETSLFDIVALATCRFAILLLIYLVLHIDHWCIVALSTSSTCAFLLSKVFLYNWSQSSQPTFEVLFVIASFVLVWGEVWHLDITAQQPHATNLYPGFADFETTPLLSSRSVSQYSLQASALSRENVNNFYTPVDSPNHSDEEQVEQKVGSGKATSLPVNIAKRVPYEPWYIKAF